MIAWASAHPILTFLLALAAINAASFLLSPPCEGWRALSPGCRPPTNATLGIPIPWGTGVYHGLVRG